MPQKPSGKEGSLPAALQELFTWGLQNVNMLYVGLPCLLLKDVEYGRRFWTLFETWCSAREATEVALITCTKGPNGMPDRQAVVELMRLQEQGLVAEISKMGVHDACKRLAKSDIQVTNKGDKVIQLAKILQLDRKARKEVKSMREESIREESTRELSTDQLVPLQRI